MKKLMVLLFAAVMILAPFADLADARGGRGRSRGAGISGKAGSRTGRGSSKDKQRKLDLSRSEERDSLIDGKLRRRSR